ncbi:MAG: hypothetical protein KAJ10_16565 [Thermodesulfovibrionia bacterium]|nr:hypothetical protein [Thermodesulfovibrionia bacterium]
MNLDALIFMLSAWGFTLGLLTFCIVTLMKNPNSKSVMTENAENNSRKIKKQE